MICKSDPNVLQLLIEKKKPKKNEIWDEKGKKNYQPKDYYLLLQNIEAKKLKKHEDFLPSTPLNCKHPLKVSKLDTLYSLKTLEFFSHCI